MHSTRGLRPAVTGAAPKPMRGRKLMQPTTPAQAASTTVTAAPTPAQPAAPTTAAPAASDVRAETYTLDALSRAASGLYKAKGGHYDIKSEDCIVSHQGQ